MTAVSFGQTTVFSESFEAGNSGTPSETCNDNSADFFTRTDGSDIGSFYEVSGQDGSFYFAAQDTDGAPCTSAIETLTFSSIDISTFTDLSFVIAAAEDDSSDGMEDWDADTFVLVEVNIDGGGFTNVLQFSGGGATNTEPGIDADFDGTADGTLLTPAFQLFSAAIGTGNSADIRITFNKLDAGDEDIALDLIQIIDGYIPPTTITITSPADMAVLNPGTTSINIDFTTANLGAGDQVDITVTKNAGMPTTTNDVMSSPFVIMGATDGDAYEVTAEIVNGMTQVDFETINFTIGSATQVVDIAALIADVGTNGVGGFYEITGAVLVTHTDGFNNRQWIQDSNISGILMYDSGGVSTTYTVGDNVSGLKGTTTTSSGVLRFVPTEDAGVIDSSGNPVTPQVVTIAAFNAAPDDYESELIQIDNVTFVDGDGMATFATGTNYDVTDGVDTVIKRTDFFGAPYIGELIPQGQIAQIIGVAGEFNGTSQIYARNLSDLTLATNGFDLDKFAVYPNPTSLGYVNISSRSQTAMKVDVFDILGKQVINSTVTNNRLDVSTLNTGLYIMKVSQDDVTTTKKLVIK